MKKILLAILTLTASSAYAGNIVMNSGAGTITGVTAGTGLTGGGTSGNVTLSLSGSGGSGASSVSQLTDCQVTRLNSTTLVIAASATITNPCNAPIGNTVYQITSSATVTLGAVTTSARIYVSGGASGDVPGGTFGVRATASSGVTCVGCTVQLSQTQFADGAYQLAIWQASVSGSWDATASADLRGLGHSYPAPTAGTGMVYTVNATNVTGAIDTTQVVRKFSGYGKPVSIAGSVVNDIYQDLGATATPSTGTYISTTAVTGWIQVGGSGGGISSVTEDYMFPFSNKWVGVGSAAGPNWIYANSSNPFLAATGTDNGTPIAGWNNTSVDTGTLSVQLPVTWDTGTVTYSVWWTQIDGGSGIVKWQAETYCESPGGSYIPSYNTPQSATGATPATTLIAVANFGALTMTGCHPGNTLKIRFLRDNTVGSNYGANAYAIRSIISLKHS